MTTLALYVVILLTLAALGVVLWWALNRPLGVFIAIAAAVAAMTRAEMIDEAVRAVVRTPEDARLALALTKAGPEHSWRYYVEVRNEFRAIEREQNQRTASQ